jgi:hypothetical protein
MQSLRCPTRPFDDFARTVDRCLASLAMENPNEVLNGRSTDIDCYLEYGVGMAFHSLIDQSDL